MGGRATAVCCTFFVVLLANGASAQQQKIGDPPEASNMRLVGTSDLQARSAYQPTIHHQGDKWIAYIGHHGGTDDIPDPVNPMTGKAEPNGTSIVDVTDPAHPKYLRHIPGQEGKYESGGAQMVRICDGKDLPKGDRNAVYMLRTFGSEAHEIWNVADPANPVLVTRIGGLKDTHKNFWECDSGIAYLVSGAPDWRTRRMTQIYDLSDPAQPKKIRDFGLPGQEPGATGAVPTELHGPISTGPKGNRVYFGYGTDKGGFLQIVDREKLLNGPKEPTPDNLKFPEIARMPLSAMNGAHTVFPMPDMPIAEFAHDRDGKSRDIVMIVDEAIQNECGEARQMVWFADVTTEARPMMISNYTVPRPPARSASAAAGSARIRRTRAWRRSITRSSPSSPSSTPASVRSTSAIPIIPGKSGTSFPPSQRRPTNAASPSTARTAARSRSRPTMSRPMSAATSTRSTAPTPACTFSN
ncbi:hypothetical protein HAP47_0009480 [Bradyrhizobium sp. 41S5]|uniref:LVIVD repeat-containing protein n=1 Tax=Bradyrhizobium sp. 41S5 TaxID=1404443 RepID=UPI001E2C3BDA|nr:hypothetical protein [Bradyrhizobium sp. 41S5]UFX46872.1 hypothetical protein HAP47_0009480 [Bradyrhizobium sp. 41S5]